MSNKKIFIIIGAVVLLVVLGITGKKMQMTHYVLHKNKEKATKHFNNLFQDTYDLTINDDQQKFKQRKLRFAEIEKVIISTPPNRIFTGSDRRMEFQFAMHKARQVNAEVEGIYIDDGTVSYLGHKSINSIFHKTIDPLLKKIVYGAWWKNALTTGSSSWISKAYLAVPKDAHPLLQTKELIPLEQDVFSTDEFLKVNDMYHYTNGGMIHHRDFSINEIEADIDLLSLLKRDSVMIELKSEIKPERIDEEVKKRTKNRP